MSAAGAPRSSSGPVLRAACIQMTSGGDVAANIDAASALIGQAAKAGATLVATPEVTSLLLSSARELMDRVFVQDDDPALAAFRRLAKKLNIWLLIGSLPILLADDGGAPVANRSFLIGADGAIVATYDKIHMFDVFLPDGQDYRESRDYRPGDRAVVAPTPWGGLGMSICYDLRFARLYRSLAQGGAGLISVPAAFTRFTGQAHWHLLLRARAIETGCYVIAPAQCGSHACGRETYGHSLIVAPWGEVLADGGEEPGFIVADLDPGAVDTARERIPALTHDRPFSLPEDISRGE